MALTIQPSFAKGELSPELHGRVDVTAYGIGLAKARNTIVHTYGGISKRPGLRFMAPVADHTYAPRLIPFSFKTTDQYILEFGDRYMRVIRNDAHVTENFKTVTLVETGNNTRLTVNAHGYQEGDEVYITSSTVPQINARRFKVRSVASSTFRIADQVTNEYYDTTDEASTSGTKSARIYKIATPYNIEDVFDINYVQSADVITLVHKDYPVYELSRRGHADWQLEEAVFVNQLRAPSNIGVTVNATGTTERVYTVTATNQETGEESLSGTGGGKVILSITMSNPVRIETTNAHGYESGEEIYLLGLDDIPQLNKKRFLVTEPMDSTVFRLQYLDGTDVNGAGFPSYSGSEGRSRTTFFKVTNSEDDLGDTDNDIVWDAPFTGAVYNIYRKDNGIFGYIGQTTDLEFTDDGIEADLDVNPPKDRNPFDRAGRYPGAVGYFSQRRVFGGSDESPDTSEFSQTGRIYNFSRANPAKDDDAISCTLTSEEVNEIRHYVPFTSLMVLTSGSEWLVSSGPDSIFSHDTVRQSPQSSWGSSKKKPIKIGNSCLFLTPDEANVRSIGYSYEIDGYTGNNLNTFSRHLLAGKTVRDWCYIRNPDSRVYMVRSDGVGLSLAYDQEQEIVAWTTFDTSGSFEACASLRGDPGGVDTVYFVVQRRVNGNIVRYIETMKQIVTNDIKQCFFVDSGLSYDNPVPIENITTSTGIRIWITDHDFDDGDDVDLSDIIWETAYDDYGDERQVIQLNGGRYKVIDVSDDSFVIGDQDGVQIPASRISRDYVSGGYARKGVSTISGLEHLEGREVIVLADGNVVTGLDVEDGQITLPRSSSIIHAGIRYVMDIETLNIETPRGTIQGKLKRISDVTLRFFNSRGMWVGPDVNNLTEMKWRTTESIGVPTRLLSGDEEITVGTTWNSGGRLFLRNNWPLPVTLLAIIPNFDVED